MSTTSRVAACVIVLAACGSPSGQPAIDGAPGDGRADDAARDPDATVPADAAEMVDAAVGPFGDPFARFLDLPPVCSADGWCWQWPRPSGTSYHRVTASSPDNIWITGGGPPSYAAVLQWNGQTWIEHKPPMGSCAGLQYCEFALPMAISTTGPNNTWLVYTNLTEHWDGSTWTVVDEELTNTHVNGVWVDPTGDAWVTRDNGIVKRWHDGVATITVAPGGVGSIWGTGPSDVFATTIGGIFHYDGIAWGLVYGGGRTAGGYQGVAGDVWVSGGDRAILHWDGTTMTDFTDAVALPVHATVMPLDYVDRADVSWIATGASAAAESFVRWDGTAFETTTIEPGFSTIGDGLCNQLTSAAVIDGRTWITCGNGGIATRTGPSTIAGIVEPIVGAGFFWGTAQDDLYQAMGSSIRHWDGASWTSEEVRIDVFDGLGGTGVDGGDELFGVSVQYVAGMYTRTFVHFDGAAWATPLPLNTGLTNHLAGVYAIAHDEALIVGALGGVYHYQGGTITAINSGSTSFLISAWGPDPDHLLIAGNGGTLLLWDREHPGVLAPDPTFPVTTDELHTVTGAGGVTWISVENANHVWRKPDGGAWEQIDTHVAPYGFVALAADDVLVNATDSGILSRWNGTSFEIEYYPSWRGQGGLYALPDGTTYVTGNGGIMVHP